MVVLTDAAGWFTLDVPEGWDSDTEDAVTTLRSPSGLSTVFLAGARHARGQQPSFGGADFLLRFLEWLGLEVEESDIHLHGGQGCRIYAFARQAGGTAWRCWSVTDDETALLIGHSRPADEPDQGEDALVDGLIQSVRLYHSNRN